MSSTNNSSANTSAHASGTTTPNEAIAPFAFEGKQSKSQSKKLWKTIKTAVVEHHKSVNAAYEVCYGQGLYRQA